MSRNVLIGIIIVLVIVAGISLLLSSGYNTPSTTPPGDTATPSVSSGSPSGQEIKEITVKGNEFAFEPSTMTLKKGEKVKVTFINEGAFPHNFTVTDLGVASSTVSAGQSTSVEFTPDQTGTFKYVCTVPTHEDKGMKGTLTVQ